MALDYVPLFHPQYHHIALRHRSSLVAGAPFPDYYYMCGPDHDVGEDAHWPPFHKAAANYIRQNFKKVDGRYSEDEEKVIAFFMGVVSHSVSDVVWHGLELHKNNGYGLIQKIGALDYNGTGHLVQAPHSMADQGAEFLLARQVDLDWFEPLKWTVPHDALIEVFKMIGDEVTYATMYECQAVFAAGAEAVKHLAESVATLFTDASPVLQEELLQMPVGGLDDGAVLTSYLWERFADWIENGPPETLPFFQPHVHKTNSAMKLTQKLGHLMMSGSLSAQYGEDSQFKCTLLERLIQSEDKDLILLLGESKVSREGLKTHYRGYCLKEEIYFPGHGLQAEKMLKISLSLEGSDLKGYAGSSIAVLKQENNVLIAVGAPGTTKSNTTKIENLEPNSFPQTGQVKGFTTSGTSEKLLSGERWYERFGEAILSSDLNCDGLDDLIVSSPTKGWEWDSIQKDIEFGYIGEVAIFLGGSNSSTPDLVISANSPMQLYGQVLSQGDVDEDHCADLIIGSPMARHSTKDRDVQNGRVDVFSSVQIRNALKSKKSLLFSSEAFKTLWGSRHFDQFGSSIDTSSGFLVIGAPGFRCDQKQAHGDTCKTKGKASTGAVYGYNISDLESPRFSIIYTIPKSQFGKSVSLGETEKGSTFLAVGASSIPEGMIGYNYGQVTIFDISKLTGVNFYENIKSHSVYNSGIGGSRFGYKVALAKTTKKSLDTDDFDLIITAPMESSWMTPDYGSVYLFTSALQNNNTITNAESTATSFFSGESRSRLGTSLLLADLNQDNLSEILIGAPRKTTQTTMTGAVYILSI